MPVSESLPPVLSSHFLICIKWMLSSRVCNNGICKLTHIQYCQTKRPSFHLQYMTNERVFSFLGQNGWFKCWRLQIHCKKSSWQGCSWNTKYQRSFKLGHFSCFNTLDTFTWRFSVPFPLFGHPVFFCLANLRCFFFLFVKLKKNILVSDKENVFHQRYLFFGLLFFVF